MARINRQVRIEPYGNRYDIVVQFHDETGHVLQEFIPYRHLGPRQAIEKRDETREMLDAAYCQGRHEADRLART